MGPPAADPSPKLSPGGVLLWTLPQGAAVGLAAADVPLWGHHPLPRSSLAVDELVVVQMIAAALLFPLVFRTARTTVVCLALMLPFDAAAQLLATTPVPAIVSAASWVTTWCLGFRAWSILSRRGHLDVWISASLMLSLFPVMLMYARLETVNASAAVRLPNPLVDVLAVANGGPIRSGIWAGLPLLLAGVGGGVDRLFRRPISASHITPPDPH